MRKHHNVLAATVGTPVGATIASLKGLASLQDWHKAFTIVQVNSRPKVPSCSHARTDSHAANHALALVMRMHVQTHVHAHVCMHNVITASSKQGLEIDVVDT